MRVYCATNTRKWRWLIRLGLWEIGVCDQHRKLAGSLTQLKFRLVCDHTENWRVALCNWYLWIWVGKQTTAWDKAPWEAIVCFAHEPGMRDSWKGSWWLAFSGEKILFGPCGKKRLYPAPAGRIKSIRHTLSRAVSGGTLNLPGFPTVQGVRPMRNAMLAATLATSPVIVTSGGMSRPRKSHA